MLHAVRLPPYSLLSEGYNNYWSTYANEQQVIAHHQHKVILQGDDERDRGAPQGQREIDCERWGNYS